MVAGTSLAPAAPGQPDVRSGRGIEETLGPKHVRLGIQARVVLHEVDAADELDGRTIGRGPDLARPPDYPGNREQEDGAMTEHLLDRGREISVATSVQVVNQPPRNGRVMSEQLKGPRELGGSRLMPGEDHGHEIVADLCCARLTATRMGPIEQHGEQASFASVAMSLVVDQLPHDLVHLGPLGKEGLPDTPPSR